MVFARLLAVVTISGPHVCSEHLLESIKQGQQQVSTKLVYVLQQILVHFACSAEGRPRSGGLFISIKSRYNRTHAPFVARLPDFRRQVARTVHPWQTQCMLNVLHAHIITRKFALREVDQQLMLFAFIKSGDSSHKMQGTLPQLIAAWNVFGRRSSASRIVSVALLSMRTK